MKYKTVLSLLIVAFFMVVSYPTFADGTEEGVYGGWDEDSGYFETISEYQNELNGNPSMSKISTKSSPGHTGKRERKDQYGNTYSRAHGWTTWIGEYHYTRARMEDPGIIFDDVILTDSGRKWGWDGTEAISPWWKFNPHVSDKARTYYGK